MQSIAIENDRREVGWGVGGGEGEIRTEGGFDFPKRSRLRSEARHTERVEPKLSLRQAIGITGRFIGPSSRLSQASHLTVNHHSLLLLTYYY